MGEKCQKAMFLLITLGNIMDFCMDWIFYHDIKNAEDGLVFGTYGTRFVIPTLVFCIIGTVTFILEFGIDIWNLRNDEEGISETVSEVMTIITLLIEDLPQIIINLLIALCREDVTNIVQIVKASSAILEVLIHISIMIAKYRKSRRENTTKPDTFCLSITFLLSLVILVLSGTVFYLETNFNKERIKFDSHGLEGAEADRYLLGVDVFMKPTDIPNIADDKWFNITDIKTITKFPDQSANIEISVLITPQYVWMKKVSTLSGESTSCYKVTTASMANPLPSAQCPGIPSQAAGGTYITMKLLYKIPNKRQPLGDILYNQRVTDVNCLPVSSPPAVTLKYFKGKEYAQINQFLTSNTDLYNIRDAWKTGRTSCPSTARDGPKLSTKIQVQCISPK